MSKPTLYIVHGWTTTTDNWQGAINELEQRGIKVHMLEVPGLTTGADKEYQISDYVDWIANKLPPHTIVLGHSNGGRILMNAISEGKITPSQLILLNSAGIYHRSLKARLSKFAARLFGKLFGQNNPLRPLVRRLLGASDYSKASADMKKTLENMLESDKKLNPARVKVPTTIIWGRKDKLTPLWQGRKLAAGIPNSTLEVVDNWTHNPYRTHPSDFAAKIATQVKDIA